MSFTAIIKYFFCKAKKTKVMQTIFEKKSYKTS